MTEKQVVDLSSLDVVKDANAGIEVELYHPGTNANLGIKIRVVGRDSTEFRKLSTQQNRRRLQKMTKGGTLKPGSISPEEMDADLIVLLAACTKGWTGVVVDGKELDFSVANAEMLYERFPWIKEQIDSAVGDRSLFTKG